ncbi:MAG TPA: DNA alkylation repair protein [Planctomycetota bacterium]
MTAKDVLAALKKAGKPATAAIYKRHGAGDNVFGALTSEIEKLRKKIKTDHALALELWASGNEEARALACQIADPATADVRAWAACSRFVSGYLAALAAKTRDVDALMAAWAASRDEHARAMGYTTLAVRLKNGDSLDAGPWIARIEGEIHASPNAARHAMNNALIAIGVFVPELRAKAVAAAKRVGKVDVDHGETSCETPDAVAYIAKAAKRR